MRAFPTHNVARQKQQQQERENMKDNRLTRTLASELQVGATIGVRTCTSELPTQIVISKVTPIKWTETIRIQGNDTVTGELLQFDYWDKAEFWK